MVNPTANSALQVWRNACLETVEVHAPEWPELAGLASCASKTYRASDGVEVLQDMAKKAFHAYRYLSSTPLAPSHPIIGLDQLVANCRDFIRAWPFHSTIPAIQALLNSALALRETESVFLREVERVASRFASGVVVSPRSNLVPLILERVVNDLDLDGLEVRTITELNSDFANHYEVSIVIGEPGSTFASFWASPKTEVRRKGWLFTAPSAAHVVSLIAGGCQSVDMDSYWLLDTRCHPLIALVDDNEVVINFPSFTRRPEEVEVSWPKVAPHPSGIGESTTLARQVSLVSGRVIFFCDEGGPQPRILRVGESSLNVLPGNLIELGPGTFLVIRSGRSYSDEIRSRAAAKLRKEGWTDTTLDHTVAAVRFLKERLQQCLDDEGSEIVRQRLRRLGLADGYAQVLITNPLDDDYIAPLEKGYDAFVEAINAPELLTTKPQIFKLRAAHRQAGAEIRDEMLRALESDPTWMDRLDHDGFVKVDVAGLGSLLIETVAKVHDQSSMVPMTRLGHLLDLSGHAFVPTADKSGLI